MQIFDRFERNFLFGLTRIFAMFIIFGILIAVIVGGVLFFYIHNETNTKISTELIIDSIKPPVATNSSSGDAKSATQKTENTNILPSVKMPFVLQKHFNTPENLQTLKKWLDTLPSYNRQEAIDEMAAIVTEAERLKLPIDHAIETYKILKKERIEAVQSEKSEQQTQQLYYAGAVISGIALIALFSLILVLLAIERNKLLKTSHPVLE